MTHTVIQGKKISPDNVTIMTCYKNINSLVVFDFKKRSKNNNTTHYTLLIEKFLTKVSNNRSWCRRQKITNSVNLCDCDCPVFQLWTSPKPRATAVSLLRSLPARRNAARRELSAPDESDLSGELKHNGRFDGCVYAHHVAIEITQSGRFFFFFFLGP